MSDDTNQVCWTDEQWNRVRKVVADEAQRARVAAQFLPLFGPVDASVVAVPDLRVTYEAIPAPPGAVAVAPGGPQRMRVDSTPNTALATISVQVALSSQDIADGEMLSALSAFRRAANIVARVEDALVFTGQGAAGAAPPGTGGIPPIFTVSNGRTQDGLASGAPAGRLTARIPRPAAAAAGAAAPPGWDVVIVNGIVNLIDLLEAQGHSGPFACFLSPAVFEAVHTPNANMVMARDRILPLLGGDYLRRSSTIPANTGVVVALGGAPVELVVASDISVRYLQTTLEPRYVFRVSERLALRVKEWNAVGLLAP